MDPVINSLVQSPLVRSMSTVPSKASSFVHGVRDNVPPFSFQKVVVQPWNNPSQTTQDQVHKFRIPQFGTLDRAYLRIKTINQVPTPANTKIVETDYASPLHEAGSAVASVDADYDTFRAKHRIPWMHDIQNGTIVNRSLPFGGGGSFSVLASHLVDPEDQLGLDIPAARDLAANCAISHPENYLGKGSNAWNAINILSEMRLTTNGKLLETVYGETIPAEVIKMPPGLRDFYIRGMVGWALGDYQGGVKPEPDYRYPWDPTACHRDLFGRYSTSEADVDRDAITTGQAIMLQNQHANFIVPVTLSSLKNLSKNYQTRFVEDLELEVTTKELGRGYNEYTAGLDLTRHHEVELVLIYHNWHDNIENTIRNSNYKRGVPASVYSTNWVRAATSVAATSNTAPISIPLTSRNLVTELLIVTRSKSVNGDALTALKRRKSDYTMFDQGDHQYKVELLGSGKTIWSGSSQELLGPDTADYDLTERRLTGGDCAYGGKRDIQSGGHSLGRFDAKSRYDASARFLNAQGVATQCGVDFSFGDNMALMRFGFQTTDEFYSGGIALQTISNPTIRITPPADLTAGWPLAARTSWTDREIEFDVYVKHSNLVRIDSDTGAVTRTLDV